MNDKGHWFAPKTHSLLPESVIDDLGLIWVALHENKLGQPGPIMPAIPLIIKYRYLSDDTLSQLESVGIPARSDTPFYFRYPDVLLPFLSTGVDKGHFFSRLADIMYCYWSIHRGLTILLDPYFVQQAQKSKMKYDRFVELISLKQEDVDTKHWLDTGLMNAKWFADATAIKIRALWDKMLQWIAQDYFCIKLGSPKWGDRKNGRIGQLESKVYCQLAKSPEKSSLDIFLKLCCELDRLREYRDGDLHYFSPRVQGVLSHKRHSFDMLALMQMIRDEANRSMEGMMTCFAIILAGAR